MSCVIIISLLGQFEMFVIKILFFLNHIFALRLCIFCLLSFEGRESYSNYMILCQHSNSLASVGEYCKFT